MSIRSTQSEAVTPSGVQPLPPDGAENACREQSAEQRVYPSAWGADEVTDYGTPPPKRVFFARVRYRHVGRGMPLPLNPEDLDDRP
jgi:hypothetical protein